MSWGAGQTYLLSCDGLASPDTPGSVWRYDDSRPLRRATAMTADAVRARSSARDFARYVLVGARPLGSHPPEGAASALKVASLSKNAPATLEGSSYGLPILLAAVSRYLALPLPPDLASTGELIDSGTVPSVAGVESKLNACICYRSPVRRVLVPKDNLVEARRWQVQAADRAKLSIEPVATITQALELAFGAERLEAALDHAYSADPERSADVLFDIALGNTRQFLPWAWLSTSAKALADLLPINSEPRWQADISSAIFDRHAGKPRPLPIGSDRWISALHGRDLRMRLTGHALQGLADSAAPDWLPSAQAAARTVAIRDNRSAADGELLGALGRLYAAWHRWGPARKHLHAAVQVWEDTHRLSGASHPLCELLRITPITAPAELPSVVAAATRFLALANLPEASSAYTRLALGRALVMAGDAPGAAVHLRGGAAPLTESRLRWLAIGGDAAARAALREGSLDHALVRLHEGAPLTTHEPALTARDNATDLRRLRELNPRASGRWISHRWRY